MSRAASPARTVRAWDVDAWSTVNDDGGDGVIRTALVVGDRDTNRVLTEGKVGMR